MYKELTYNNVKIRISDGDIANLRLLQVDGSKAKLSQLRYGKDIPQAIINCSYFTTSYVLGRNQGDVRQDTSSFSDQAYLGFATTESGYVSGELNFWDAEKSQCGFTPACIIIKDGKDVQMASTSFVTYDGKMKIATCVSMFGVLDDKKTCILVTCDKGLSGYQLASYLKSMYKLDFLCILDGGGSTEHIVNGTIVQKSTDGTERSMFNGLALIQPKEEPLELYYPCVEGWGSQGFHSDIRD